LPLWLHHKIRKKTQKKDIVEKLARLPAWYLCGNQHLKNICTEFSFPSKISVMKYSRQEKITENAENF
jgi:hypothetical protein